MTEQIDIDAGQIIVNDSRGIDQQAEQLALYNTYGYGSSTSGAVKAAKTRQTSVVYGLSLAQSQSAVLAEELNSARTTASRLHSNLSDVKTTAVTDLDNATAGDATLTALTTLIAAIDATIINMRAVSGLTYEGYRDE